MSKTGIKLLFMHKSVLRNCPQFPSTSDSTVASVIRAWLLQSCRLDIDQQEFDTSSSASSDALFFPTPVVVQGPSRAATRPLAIARVLLQTGLVSQQEFEKTERSACAVHHVFGGAGKHFLHFVFFKPFKLKHFLRWAVPDNCGPEDLICTMHKENENDKEKEKEKPDAFAYQPLACAHVESCGSDGEDAFVQRVMSEHLLKCLNHTSTTPLTDDERIRARGCHMSEANLAQTVQFFADPAKVDATDRRQIPIETWAAFHPMFKRAQFDSNNVLIVPAKKIASLIPKPLKPLLTVVCAANMNSPDEWKVARVKAQNLTEFLRSSLALVREDLKNRGYSLEAFGGFDQWTEHELAYALASLPAPKRVEPFIFPPQKALNFAYCTLNARAVRLAKPKSNGLALQLLLDEQLHNFYLYYCSERSKLSASLNDAEAWKKLHKVSGTEVVIVSFSEVRLFFELLAREMGCDGAALAANVPLRVDAARFDAATEGLQCK